MDVPGPVAVNPSLTIVALALRVVESVAKYLQYPAIPPPNKRPYYHCGRPASVGRCGRALDIAEVSFVKREPTKAAGYGAGGWVSRHSSQKATPIPRPLRRTITQSIGSRRSYHVTMKDIYSLVKTFSDVGVACSVERPEPLWTRHLVRAAHDDAIAVA